MYWGNVLEFATHKVSNGEYLTHETMHHNISIASRKVYFYCENVQVQVAGPRL